MAEKKQNNDSNKSKESVKDIPSIPVISSIEKYGLDKEKVEKRKNDA